MVLDTTSCYTKRTAGVTQSSTYSTLIRRGYNHSACDRSEDHGFLSLSPELGGNSRLFFPACFNVQVEGGFLQPDSQSVGNATTLPACKVLYSDPEYRFYSNPVVLPCAKCPLVWK